jgi:hypothetical protein
VLQLKGGKGQFTAPQQCRPTFTTDRLQSEFMLEALQRLLFSCLYPGS